MCVFLSACICSCICIHIHFFIFVPTLEWKSDSFSGNSPKERYDSRSSYAAEARDIHIAVRGWQRDEATEKPETGSDRSTRRGGLCSPLILHLRIRRRFRSRTRARFSYRIHLVRCTRHSVRIIITRVSRRALPRVTFLPYDTDASYLFESLCLETAKEKLFFL